MGEPIDALGTPARGLRAAFRHYFYLGLACIVTSVQRTAHGG